MIDDAGERSVQFWHDRVRQAVDATTTAEHRRARHLALARRLAARDGPRGPGRGAVRGVPRRRHRRGRAATWPPGCCGARPPAPGSRPRRSPSASWPRRCRCRTAPDVHDAIREDWHSVLCGLGPFRRGRRGVRGHRRFAARARAVAWRRATTSAACRPAVASPRRSPSGSTCSAGSASSAPAGRAALRRDRPRVRRPARVGRDRRRRHRPGAARDRRSRRARRRGDPRGDPAGGLLRRSARVRLAGDRGAAHVGRRTGRAPSWSSPWPTPAS